MTDAPAPKPLKIAIVGTAPTSKFMAPTKDPDWQIWACSAGNMGQLERVDVWYEMHALNEMMAPENRGFAEPFFKWLRDESDAGKMQVVMIQAGIAFGGDNDLVPKAIPYPRDRMIERFGRNWFTSTVAYMMAAAIDAGATEIGLFGVDMAAQQEHYEAQRAGAVRFIEIAREAGIQVHIPFESCLNAVPPMYGYWEGTPFGRRINATMQIVTRGHAEAQAQELAARDQRNYFAGAMEQLRYFQRTWTDGAELDVNLGSLAEHFAPSAPPAAAGAPGAASPRIDLPIPPKPPEPAPAAPQGADSGGGGPGRATPA